MVYFGLANWLPVRETVEHQFNEAAEGVYNGIWNSTVGLAEYIYRPSKFVEMGRGMAFLVQHPQQAGRAIYQIFRERPVKETCELVTCLGVGYGVGKVATKLAMVAKTQLAMVATATVQASAVHSWVQPIAQFKKSLDWFAQLSASTCPDYVQQLPGKLTNLKELANQLPIKMDLVDDLCTAVDKLNNAGVWYHTNKHGKALSRLGEVSRRGAVAVDGAINGVRVLGRLREDEQEPEEPAAPPAPAAQPPAHEPPEQVVGDAIDRAVAEVNARLGFV